MSASYFKVRFVTVVDRPDRRGPDFIAVPAGHRFSTDRDYRTRREALKVFASIIRGDEDYGSEYVASVEVLDCDCYRERSPKWVRRLVERKRRPGAGRCFGDCGHALCLETDARDRADGLIA